MFLIQIYFYYFLVAYKVSIKSVEKIIVLFSIALFILFVAQYYLYPLKIFNSDIGVSSSSEVLFRWTFYGQGFISLGLLFTFNKYHEKKDFKYLVLSIMLFIYFLLQGSRSIMIAIIIAILFLLYKNEYFKFTVKNFVGLLLIVLCVIAIINIPKVNKIINYTINRSFEDKNLKEDYVRFVQLDYFLNAHAKNNIEFILGSGVPGDTEYGRGMNSIADASENVIPINWVDLGFIGLAIIVGFSFSISLLYILIKEAVRKKVHSRYYYIQSWYVYLIFATIFYPTAFIGGNMIVLALTMYVLERGNKMKKFSKNYYEAINYYTRLQR